MGECLGRFKGPLTRLCPAAQQHPWHSKAVPAPFNPRGAWQAALSCCRTPESNAAPSALPAHTN